MYPRIDHYCSLCLDWISIDQVSTAECCSVWRNILKHWISSSGKIKQCLGRQRLWLPAYTSIVDIQLSAPNETFIPDDLKLKELFMRGSARENLHGILTPLILRYHWIHFSQFMSMLELRTYPKQ